MKNSPTTDQLKIAALSVTEGAFAPSHIDDLLKLSNTGITQVACNYDLIAATGGAAPAMESRIDKDNRQRWLAARPSPTLTSIRFRGAVQDLRRVFGDNKHNVGAAYHTICGQELHLHPVATGFFTQ